MSAIANRFGKIYRERLWDAAVLSGPGSRPSVNRRYLRLVQRLVNRRGVQRVLELGCGDWTLSQCIDWRRVSYHGVDVVADVIEQNRRKHACENIRFDCLDVLEDELPSADLVIIKDVLQHLPNAAVSAVLAKLSRYGAVLCTNDYERRFRYVRWGLVPRYAPSDPAPNSDIDAGGYRPLQLNAPPFFWEGKRLFTYPVRYVKDAIDVKEVLLKAS
jgi:SAM-dependent methyltransferase